jgi:hypothetical protein
LTLGDPPDLIQMQAPLSLGFLRILHRAKQVVHEHGNSNHRCSGKHSGNFPISNQYLQRLNSIALLGPRRDTAAKDVE